MSDDKLIPDGSGAITSDRLVELVEQYKAFSASMKIMDRLVQRDKVMFRREAGRMMGAAAPGTTRVEFSDGDKGCVMISTLDLSKKANRKQVPMTLLQMAEQAGVDMEGKLETKKTMAVSSGKTKEILAALEGSEEALILTGDMVGWLRGVFAAQEQVLPESVITFTADVDITVNETHQLTEAAASELRARMQTIAATGEKLDGAEYDAMKALFEASIKASPVNIR